MYNIESHCNFVNINILPHISYEYLRQNTQHFKHETIDEKSEIIIG